MSSSWTCRPGRQRCVGRCSAWLISGLLLAGFPAGIVSASQTVLTSADGTPVDLARPGSWLRLMRSHDWTVPTATVPVSVDRAVAQLAPFMARAAAQLDREGWTPTALVVRGDLTPDVLDTVVARAFDVDPASVYGLIPDSPHRAHDHFARRRPSGRVAQGNLTPALPQIRA
jgi:hypothetical protein